MVFNNLSSGVLIKTTTAIGTSSFFGNPTVSSELDISGKIVSFQDMDFKSDIIHDAVSGNNVFTTVSLPKSGTFSFEIIGDSTTTSLTDIIKQLTYSSTVSGGITTYDDSDDKKRHRIAVYWSDGTNTYLKAYYNAYLIEFTISDTETIKVKFDFSVPIKDIATGYSNIYEYEGESPTSAISTLDTRMEWT